MSLIYEQQIEPFQSYNKNVLLVLIKSNTITLTVQSNGSGGWRLGLNKDDSIKYFTQRESVCFDLTNNHM
jgi:hypothetical protein